MDNEQFKLKQIRKLNIYKTVLLFAFAINSILLVIVIFRKEWFVLFSCLLCISGIALSYKNVVRSIAVMRDIEIIDE